LKVQEKAMLSFSIMFWLRSYSTALLTPEIEGIIKTNVKYISSQTIYRMLYKHSGLVLITAD
jgi:hypothetical protein